MVPCVGCEISLLNGETAFETAGLSAGEESGILGVAVECVDIKKNTGGVGGSLECN